MKNFKYKIKTTLCLWFGHKLKKTSDYLDFLGEHFYCLRCEENIVKVEWTKDDKRYNKFL